MLERNVHCKSVTSTCPFPPFSPGAHPGPPPAGPTASGLGRGRAAAEPRDWGGTGRAQAGGPHRGRPAPSGPVSRQQVNYEPVASPLPVPSPGTHASTGPEGHARRRPAEPRGLYAWLDGLPLSRPKRHLARDFSDSVMLAEIVKHFHPQLVDLHNYVSSSNTDQKLANWNTLNRRGQAAPHPGLAQATPASGVPSHPFSPPSRGSWGLPTRRKASSLGNLLTIVQSMLATPGAPTGSLTPSHLPPSTGNDLGARPYSGQTWREKVLHKLRLGISEADIGRVVASVPGAVEPILWALREKVQDRVPGRNPLTTAARVRAHRTGAETSGDAARHSHTCTPISRGAPLQPLASQGSTLPPTGPRTLRPTEPLRTRQQEDLSTPGGPGGDGQLPLRQDMTGGPSEHLDQRLGGQEQVLAVLQETVKVLARLEHLVRLKDVRISALKRQGATPR
ncbi:uncharacterized protein LOC143654470 isoform X2 [Tamandua tetradactyla]|uniref:uncharacterized protein LOC143654470 isoform X2 n=1 Tax=Tamandua tetradactyla TaxID=48850 RepID=UPI004054027E